jgi:hypothetical protein
VSPFGKRRKLVDRVVVTHRPVAFAANGTQVVNIGRTTFTFWDVVTHLETKGCDDILAPRHQALVLEVDVAAIKEPYLFTERTWYLLLHKEGWI